MLTLQLSPQAQIRSPQLLALLLLLLLKHLRAHRVPVHDSAPLQHVRCALVSGGFAQSQWRRTVLMMVL